MKPWMIGLAALVACSEEPEPLEAAPPVGTLRVIQLAPGSAWDVERSLEDIASNELVPHNEVIADRFARGELLANALRADGTGFYLYDAAVVDAEALIADDPAVQTDLLTPVLEAEWTLSVEDLGASIPDAASVFLVETTGVGTPTAAATVLAAGTWDVGGSLLVVVADSEDAAHAAVEGAEDVSAVAWGNPAPFPRFFHRRSLADTVEVR